MADSQIRSGNARANDIEFGILEAGSGPLALRLHGFPDSAHTWRHLLPLLAEAGFHAVAPFTRGYAPTGIPADGAYQVGALVSDAVALHEALGGDGDAVLIGHDWGAETAYAAAAYAPDRWRRIVTLGVPPAGLDAALLSDYDQLKRFFYIFMFRDTPGLAEAAVAADGMSFIDKLWSDWSPGFDPREHLVRVKDCLRDPANLAAAIGYYRAVGLTEAGQGEQNAPAPAGQYQKEEQAVGRPVPQPVLYLHGADDGCIAASLARRAESLLSPASRMVVVEHAGHFPHLERPGEVNARILQWLT
jgi:pimeloyl-ACP methyl ester carboxylesterase